MPHGGGLKTSLNKCSLLLKETFSFQLFDHKDLFLLFFFLPIYILPCPHFPLLEYLGDSWDMAASE